MLAMALAHTLLYRSEQWKDLAKPTSVAAVLANLPGITLRITIATVFQPYSVEGPIQRLGFTILFDLDLHGRCETVAPCSRFKVTSPERQ